MKRQKEYCHKNVVIFKPDTDKRFSEDNVVSRDNRKQECIVIPKQNPEYMRTVIDATIDIVAIDEAQFFEANIAGETIVDMAQYFADMGIIVYVCGLDMTHARVPFNSMPDILAVADDVVKLKSVCEDCGEEDGMYSYSPNMSESESVKIGDTEYKTLCRRCFIARKKNKR
jgi:thymidine kinase